MSSLACAPCAVNPLPWTDTGRCPLWLQVSVWVGLTASNSTWEWSGISSSASAAALQNFSRWCMPLPTINIMGVQLPNGYGRGGGSGVATAAAAIGSGSPAEIAAAVATAASSVVSMCAVLRYDEARCFGWGWDPEPCSTPEPYLCQLSTEGVNNGHSMGQLFHVTTASFNALSPA